MLRHIARLSPMGRRSDSGRGQTSYSMASRPIGVFGAYHCLYHRQLPYVLRLVRSVLLHLFLLTTISVLPEIALQRSFEASVTVTEDNRFTQGRKIIWVNLPVDRPGDGLVSIPLHLFKKTMVDRFIMPLLFALMLLFSSLAFVFSMGLMDL